MSCLALFCVEDRRQPTLCTSGAVSPLTWSPDKTTKSGFSSSSTLSTNSMVLGSASQCPPLWPGGSASLQWPRPVLRCRSDICMILNLPSFLILGTGFSSLAAGPLRMLRRGSVLALPVSRCRAPFLTSSQLGRGSTASAPKRMSTAVTAFLSSLA